MSGMQATYDDTCPKNQTIFSRKPSDHCNFKTEVNMYLIKVEIHMAMGPTMMKSM